MRNGAGMRSRISSKDRGGGQRRLNPGVLVALPEAANGIRVVQKCADLAETYNESGTDLIIL
jgi:hypothetical protein